MSTGTAPEEHCCIGHADRRATHACSCCGRYVCDECVINLAANKFVCSPMCAERMAERAREEETFNTLPGWGTRIWTSAFLILLLAGLGSLAGCYICVRGTARVRRN